MRSLLTLYIAVLIAIGAIQSSPVTSEFVFSESDSLAKQSWNNDSVVTVNFKKDLKLALVPTFDTKVSHSPISYAADEILAYYLPIFSLYRPGHYFLLV